MMADIPAAGCIIVLRSGTTGSNEMTERFERHRQPWRQDEIQRLHQLAGKGMSVRAIAKALTRSEESVKDRAKLDRIKIAKLR
jgi:DNA-binding NarL/FixJ family response regulator